MEYTDEMLDEINENVDLLEYASQYMDFVKRGNTYYTNCPMHTDKTPSLAIKEGSNYYHCFSCGISGNIIKFLRDFEGLSFKDAVEKAAKIANVNMDCMCKSNTVAFLRGLEKAYKSEDQPIQHDIIADSEYTKYKHEPINEWLDEGISQEVMDKFGVRADTYKNRIVYPVYDIDGNLINIKGRTRYKDYKSLNIPKYVNYYPIGRMDYFQGLNITLPDIKDKNEAIIFESIKSVMLAYQWGYRNCVSAEKHSLTREQINLLAKLRVNVVFAYDADVDYWHSEVIHDIEKIKRITNVFVVTDPKHLLGGRESKNAPVDCGKLVWEELYKHKVKVV